MQAKELRKRLHQLLDMADDKTIEARFKKGADITIEDVFAVVGDVVHTNELHEEIVGYTAEGKPINKEEFIKRIRQSEEEYERGNYISLDDLKKESEDW